MQLADENEKLRLQVAELAEENEYLRSKIKTPTSSESVPVEQAQNDSIDFEELVQLARMPAQKVRQQLEQKGFVVAGSKIYESVSGNPDRFIIKKKRN